MTLPRIHQKCILLVLYEVFFMLIYIITISWHSFMWTNSSCSSIYAKKIIMVSYALYPSFHWINLDVIAFLPFSSMLSMTIILWFNINPRINLVFVNIQCRVKKFFRLIALCLHIIEQTWYSLCQDTMGTWH